MEEISKSQLQAMRLAPLIFLVAVVLGFNPKLYEFKVYKLLSNVPEAVIKEDPDLDILNYIDYSSRFINNFDRYNYLLNGITEEDFNLLNTEMVTVSHDNALIWYYEHAKSKIKNQWRLINNIVKRHKLYTIYLLKTTTDEFMMIVPDLNYNLDYLIKWITNTQSMHLIEGKSWCTFIDYFNEVKFVKLGRNPWVTCEEIGKHPH